MLDFLDERAFDELEHSSFSFWFQISEFAVLLLELFNRDLEFIRILIFKGIDIEILIHLIDLYQWNQLFTFILDTVESIVELIIDQAEVFFV